MLSKNLRTHEILPEGDLETGIVADRISREEKKKDYNHDSIIC